VHRVYVEPFVGGAAVFFAKPPSKMVVINDINGELVNFYKVVKNDFQSLQKVVESTLQNRRTL
jgi:DNA adenine methylase